MIEFIHKPVLLEEVTESFKKIFSKNEIIFLDGTLGFAGHSIEIAKFLKIAKKQFTIIGIDKDQKALEIAKQKIDQENLSEFFELINDDFHNTKEIIQNMNISYISGALLDLGVSSMQLDDKSRGFSFEQKDAPLDMRMNQNQGKTAADILNFSTEKELAQILKDGEEKYYNAVAKNIFKFRKEKEIKTVGDLINILAKSLPKKSGKTHFATDTFRALRLATNNEIVGLERAIFNIVETLESGGQIAIITFHSIEDRIVKNLFRTLENPCVCPPDLPFCHCGKKPVGKIITKKPIVAQQDEIDQNPRSRSAKLRIFQKN